MLNANSASTPSDSSSSLANMDKLPPIDPQVYRQVVGSLQYLCITRPDLAFAINRVSQSMHDPKPIHLRMVKRILRYLVDTKQHGLLLSRHSDARLYVYSDADWGGAPEDRKSMTGFVIYFGRNLIS